MLESLKPEGDEVGPLIAVVSPSSKALRWTLKNSNIDFHLPFDHKKGIAYSDSVEPDQVGQLSREKYEQSEISQIIVHGESEVFKLIQVLNEKFEREYLNGSFHIPRISSAFPFDHSKYERIPLTASGNLTRTVQTGTQTFVRI